MGMFVFGVIVGYIYKKARYYQDGRHMVYYLIICQMIFKSLQMYPFSNKTYLSVLLIISILEVKDRGR